MAVTTGESLQDLPPCDLVMKGGITSGVVYPGAAVELAKQYRFKNIGGTSVGAISAAVIAAAEYGRQAGHADAWSHVDNISTQLKGEGFVRSKFQPAQSTKAVFDLAMKLAEPKRSNLGRALRVVWWLTWHHPLIWLTADVLIGALVVLNVVSFSHLSIVPAVVLAVASVLVFLAAYLSLMGLAVYLTGRKLVKALVENGFGFCTGMSESDQPGDALIEWLHKTIQACSGLGEDGPPLTFRMLKEKHDISLSMVTTNLSYAQPERLPFRKGAYLFYPREMLKRFPREIVERMIAPDGSPIPDAEWGRTQVMPGLDLPIVVAARLSLSFPFLFSGMLLHSNHPYTEDLVDDWFSDGGISSNFPIHVFDSWFPRHPTFGLDLQSVADKGAERPVDTFGNKSDVYLPPSGPDGYQSPHWSGTKGIGGFIKQIKDAVQNWRDTAQAQLPGSRDRVCQIRLYEGQGGLNLDMDPEVIDLLDARGRQAGAEFKKFSFSDHQWVRYLLMMQLLQQNLVGLEEAFNAFDPALRAGVSNVTIYRNGHQLAWCGDAAQATKTLLGGARGWKTGPPPDGGFDQGSEREPAPTPVMRATPGV